MPTSMPVTVYTNEYHVCVLYIILTVAVLVVSSVNVTVSIFAVANMAILGRNDN